MRLAELFETDILDTPITEAPELQSSINAVTSEIGNTLMGLYNTLDTMLDRYIANHKSSDGFPLVAGGVAARWFHQRGDFLINNLIDLARQAGANGTALKQWNLTRYSSFGPISRTLPDILVELGRRINAVGMVRNATAWKAKDMAYRGKIRQYAGEEDESEPTPQPQQPQRPRSAIPNQNVQAEEIVNGILRRLPGGVAGEVRNAIARSGNKLVALQQELQRRGIRIN